jgi:hypothetical protein
VTLTWEVTVETTDPATAIMVAAEKVRQGQTGATLNDAWAHRLPDEEETDD